MYRNLNNRADNINELIEVMLNHKYNLSTLTDNLYITMNDNTHILAKSVKQIFRTPLSNSNVHKNPFYENTNEQEELDNLTSIIDNTKDILTESDYIYNSNIVALHVYEQTDAYITNLTIESSLSNIAVHISIYLNIYLPIISLKTNKPKSNVGKKIYKPLNFIDSTPKKNSTKISTTTVISNNSKFSWADVCKKPGEFTTSSITSSIINIPTVVNNIYDPTLSTTISDVQVVPTFITNSVLTSIEITKTKCVENNTVWKRGKQVSF